MEIGNFHRELEFFLYKLQEHIIYALETTDGKGIFAYETWQRNAGGGGRSAIIENGSVLEKAGVNVSAVFGNAPLFLFQEKEHSFLASDTNPDNLEFYATGLSLVIHPLHPRVPIIHMNIRYFELSNGIWWFGGGIDLTPIYVDEVQAKDFHAALKRHCDAFHPEFYNKFKTWADDYFFLPHRNETRGIGGIFFDRLNERSGLSKSHLLDFWKKTGELFIVLYIPLVEKNRILSFDEREKKWQLLRRSRYVEFNLLYDKGTRFGLETGGRTESILMSLPPLARWEHNASPDPNSEEAKTLQWLKKGIDWTK